MLVMSKSCHVRDDATLTLRAILAFVKWYEYRVDGSIMSLKSIAKVLVLILCSDFVFLVVTSERLRRPSPNRTTTCKLRL